MGSRKQVLRQITLVALLPHFAVLGGFILLMRAAGAPGPVVKGALLYLVLSVGLRRMIPRAHRRGLRLIRKDAFGAAIPAFEESYAFFSRNRWLDDYRHLALLSWSRMSYREMALLNQAYCYGRTGKRKKSKELYERTLDEFPASTMARTALNMFAQASRTGTANPRSNR